MKNGDIITLSDGGINWNWYLQAKIVWPHGAMKVEILKHYRVHKDDEGHPECVGSFRIIENTSRTACAVEISIRGDAGHTRVCAVENPKNVFNY